METFIISALAYFLGWFVSRDVMRGKSEETNAKLLETLGQRERELDRMTEHIISLSKDRDTLASDVLFLRQENKRLINARSDNNAE